ncbi:hypothetical protein [Streptomyces noursei]|uniref:DUF7224 domain-containing protein n=1 Tax=Streptomyces noursei TaxID=1971 RepID=UPI001675BB1B|nr:hypothetical protein [Streptomyces noursei]MCZ1021174.1 hypothetical protein [Streptomyces noursei]
MHLTTVLRSGPILWAALILLPGLVWLNSDEHPGKDAYWEAATSNSLLLLGFTAAVCGACAAWEGSRLAVADVGGWAPVRSPIRIAYHQLLPTALLGVLALVVTLLASGTEALGGYGYPNVLLLVMATVVVLGHIAAGYAVGLRMPRLLGAAVMLGIGYFWGFWPASLAEPTWLRHLNGQGVSLGASLDQIPSVRSAAATLTLYAGIVTTIALLLTLRRGKQRTVVSSLTAALALAGSLTLAVPLGFTTTQPRDRALYQCNGSRPQLCTWPEQRPYQEQFAHLWQQAQERLYPLGIFVRERYSPGTITPQRVTNLEEIATSPLPEQPPQCAQDHPYPGADATSAIRPWLAMAAGLKPSDLLDHWAKDDVTRAEEVRKLPLPQQRAWYERNMQAVRDCSVQPELTPAAFGTATAQRKEIP